MRYYFSRIQDTVPTHANEILSYGWVISSLNGLNGCHFNVNILKEFLLFAFLTIMSFTLLKGIDGCDLVQLSSSAVIMPLAFSRPGVLCLYLLTFMNIGHIRSILTSSTRAKVLTLCG